MARLLMPLASRDFDVTEVVVPWDAARRAGHQVVFATEDGLPGRCDPRLLTGVIFGKLGARPENVARYRELESAQEFVRPLRWNQMREADFAGLLLHGGHAPGMRQYLEGKPVQEATSAFVRAGKPVGAICHGGVVLARSIDPATGRSVLAGRRATALTKILERTAFLLTFWKLGRYYRTYPEYVEDEVRRALGEGSFEAGPFASYDNPFTVSDGNLVTARWPGDAVRFAADFLSLL
jgi:putative intracellular protease/amidase